MKNLDISAAVHALKNGEVIVYPTDTIYGFGVDIFNNDAIKKLYKIKNRPQNLPISVAVNNFEEVNKIAYTNNKIIRIIDCFLPGPLSFIAKKKDNVPKTLTGGTNKIAIRIIDNKIAREIIKNFGPITSTSANVHGKATPSVISEISMQFKDQVKIYLDDGILKAKASTLVDLSQDQPKILRQGIISKDQILDCIKNE